VRYELNLKMYFRSSFVCRWPRHGSGGQSPAALWAGCDPGSFHVISAVDKVALGGFLLRVVQFVSVFIIPPILLTHLHLNVAPTGTTNGRSLETSQKATFFGNRGALDSKELVRFSGINVRYNLAGIPSEIRQKRTSNMAPALTSGYQRTILNRWSRTKHNTSV